MTDPPSHDHQGKAAPIDLVDGVRRVYGTFISASGTAPGITAYSE